MSIEEPDKDRRDSPSFRVSNHDGMWRGIAFDEEKVVEFAFGIDKIVDNTVIFGLVIEKNILGVKVFDAFNEIFSRYIKIKDVKIEAYAFIVNYGKPELADPIGFKKSDFHSVANFYIEKIGWKWNVYGEDRDQIIRDIEKLLSLDTRNTDKKC